MAKEKLFDEGYNPGDDGYKKAVSSKSSGPKAKIVIDFFSVMSFSLNLASGPASDQSRLQTSR